MRQEMMGSSKCSGISWTICKQSVPRSRQTITPTLHHRFLQARSSSWHPTNSDRALKVWTICKQSVPRSRQTITPTLHHSIFTGQILFLTPNQQWQSTEGAWCSTVVVTSWKRWAISQTRHSACESTVPAATAATLLPLHADDMRQMCRSDRK